MGDKPELKPCPFCGSAARREIRHDILHVECSDCLTGFHNHVRFGCVADDEWNTRADLAKPSEEGQP